MLGVCRLKDIVTLQFRGTSREELLPGFEADFPCIASRTHLTHTMPWHWHKELELFYVETGALTPDEALELTSIYRASGMQNAYQNLAARLVTDPQLPLQHVLALANFFAQDQRVDALIYTLEQYTQRDPNNLDAWLDLAAGYAFVRRDADAVRAARQSIQLGGDQARNAILQDPRFQPLATNREFHALFTRPGGGGLRPLAPLPGGALPNLPGLAR